MAETTPMPQKNNRREDSSKKSEGLGENVAAYTDSTLYEISLSGIGLPVMKGGLKILDLCSGKGMATAPFKENNEIFYLELSEDMIQEGREEGYIEAPQDHIFIGDAKKILSSREFRQDVGKFDLIVHRFGIHDFTSRKYELFMGDENEYYRRSLAEQKEFIKSVKNVLHSDGEFQLIDTAVPHGEPSQVKHLYNHYHMLKTHGKPISVHIPRAKNLKKIAKKSGFSVYNLDWYGSTVNLKEWFYEGQVTEERYQLLKGMFRGAYSDPVLRENFSIVIEEDNIVVTFPVVILTLRY